MQWLDNSLLSILREMLLLYSIALIVSSIGFYRTVYFVSIGYAFSIAAMAIAAPLMHTTRVTMPLVLHNVLLVAWGLRLGIFLIMRERGASYGNEQKNTEQRSAGIGYGKKILIWVSVSILYVLMFSPSFFSLIAERRPTTLIHYAVSSFGLLLMLVGLAIEALSDGQKSKFKSQYPARFCNRGLYRWVRCPNYLGEIIFWSGNWLAGMLLFDSLLRWIAPSIGLVCIILIMIGSAKRLERGQEQRYGGSESFEKYVRTVPILFPFLPIYSLKKVRVFLE